MVNSKNQIANIVLLPVNKYDTIVQALHEKLIDAQTPGYQAEFDPDEAEHAGAFVEDALSEEDAIDSGDDPFTIDDKKGDVI